MSHGTKRNHLLGAMTLLIAMMSLVVSAPGARAQTAGDIIDLAGYRIVTTVKNPDGTEFTRTTPALVAVPQVVNADRSVLSLPDFSVVVIPSPGLISMQVVKLSTAALPAKVELVFDLPGAGEKKLGVGYDTLSSGARSPVGFGATASFSLGSPLVVDAHTSVVGPGASLAILGSLFEETADAPRANAKSARIEYTPVPEDGRLRLRLEELEAERTIDVRAETDRRVKAVIDASDVSPGAEQRLSTTVVGMPSELDVGLDLPEDKDNGRLDFNYAANERADSIDAHGTKLTGGTIELDVLAKVTDMSRKLDVVKEGKSRVTMDADAAIDQIDVGSRRARRRSSRPRARSRPGCGTSRC